MTQLPWANKRSYTGWNTGLLEGAEPSAGRDEAGRTAGVTEENSNFAVTPAGRLGVRGGTGLTNEFTEAGASLPMSQMLTHWPFTPTGAVIAGWHLASSKHYLWLLDSYMDFFSGVEATSRIDLTAAPSTAWDVGPARPVFSELFEKMYLADATLDYTNRNTLLSIDNAGTVVEPAFNFDGGSEPLRPYTVEEYNNVLFIAGYDSAAEPDSPAIVRHSFLGKDPAAADGFDALAWNIVGAKGQRVSGMKKGKNILILAKENELYRLSGNGRAREGWQYAVDRVTDSQGHGAANPLALSFRDPYWYGIGQAGPWRSNGNDVERLDLSRRISWKKVSKLDRAFVSYHPERNAMIFGVHMTPAPEGYTTNYPYTFWLWDIDREAWTSDWRNSMGVFYMRAIHAKDALSSVASGPAGIPDTPTVSDVDATLTSVRITFAVGDATAATEVWLKNAAGGAYFRHSSAPAAAGPVTVDLTGLDSATNYTVKLRHAKNGVYSAFSAEADSYTRIPAPPAPTAVGSSVLAMRMIVAVTGTVADADLLVYRATGPVLIDTLVAFGIGTTAVMDSTLACGTSMAYYTVQRLNSWPVVIQESVPSGNSLTKVACTNG